MAKLGKRDEVWNGLGMMKPVGMGEVEKLVGDGELDGEGGRDSWES